MREAAAIRAMDDYEVSALRRAVEARPTGPASRAEPAQGDALLPHEPRAQTLALRSTPLSGSPCTHCRTCCSLSAAWRSPCPLLGDTGPSSRTACSALGPRHLPHGDRRMLPGHPILSRPSPQCSSSNRIHPHRSEVFSGAVGSGSLSPPTLIPRHSFCSLSSRPTGPPPQALHTYT